MNRGKSFELVIREDIEKLGDVYILRLYDPQGGYASVANPCDFIAYHKNKMFMFECKSIKTNTFPIYGNDPKKKYGNISNTQWEGMLQASKHGIVSGVLLWWIDADVTRFIPIQLLKQLRDSGAKSVRYDTDMGIIINGKKKRVFFEYDFREFFDNI